MRQKNWTKLSTSIAVPAASPAQVRTRPVWIPFIEEPTILFPRNIVTAIAARYRTVQTTFIAISPACGPKGEKSMTRRFDYAFASEGRDDQKTAIQTRRAGETRLSPREKERSVGSDRVGPGSPLRRNQSGLVRDGDTIRRVMADATRPTVARLVEERYFSAMDRIESLP